MAIKKETIAQWSDHNKRIVTVDLGRGKHRLKGLQGQRFHEGLLQGQRCCGTSAMTPGSDSYLGSSQQKDKECALKSSTET